jgi:hypothetical protein
MLFANISRESILACIPLAAAAVNGSMLKLACMRVAITKSAQGPLCESNNVVELTLNRAGNQVIDICWQPPLVAQKLTFRNKVRFSGTQWFGRSHAMILACST